MSESITIINTQDGPVNFYTQFNSTIYTAEANFEICLSEIYYGRVCNVTPDNNHFYISYTGEKEYKRSTLERTMRFTIPVGNYTNIKEILKYMKWAISSYDRKKLDYYAYFWFVDLVRDFKLTFWKKKKGILTPEECKLLPNLNTIDPTDFIAYPSVFDSVTEVLLKPDNSEVGFYEPEDEVTLLSLLGYRAGEISELRFDDTSLSDKNEIGLVYCSLISNSRLNAEKTNLLAVVPLQSKNSKFNHYCVKNPTYHPLTLTSFDRIHFEIRNLIQEPIHLKHTNIANVIYPTIITLHIRKKLMGSL